VREREIERRKGGGHQKNKNKCIRWIGLDIMAPKKIIENG